jgi:predicted TIM-barrel enzyme
MNRFRKVFSSGHVILPVIHVSALSQALRNVEVARNAGADGVFLINHSMHWPELLKIHSAVADAFPGWWIGVNCLGLGAKEVFTHVSNQVSGVWTDNAAIEEDEIDQRVANDVLQVKAKARWDGLYFGGVAFKYQAPVDDLAKAAKIASRYMDVVTTSGSGTGKAADIGKIKKMKDALGAYPLAIASGITPENVVDYLPVSDCYLVATGIGRTFEELDPALVSALVQNVREYDRENGASRSKHNEQVYQ